MCWRSTAGALGSEGVASAKALVLWDAETVAACEKAGIPLL